MAQTDDEQSEFTRTETLPGQETGGMHSKSFMSSQDNVSNSSPAEKTQVPSNTFSGSFDDLDIPYIDEDDDTSNL